MDFPTRSLQHDPHEPLDLRLVVDNKNPWTQWARDRLFRATRRLSSSTASLELAMSAARGGFTADWQSPQMQPRCHRLFAPG
jgi:hypothetical protein